MTSGRNTVQDRLETPQYNAARTGLCFVVMMLCFAPWCRHAWAQTTGQVKSIESDTSRGDVRQIDDVPTWRVHAGTEVWSWVAPERHDSLSAAAAVLGALQEAGFFGARIDSVVADSGRVYVTPGPAARLTVAELTEVRATESAESRTLTPADRDEFADSLLAKPFSAARLQKTVDRLLGRLESRGYPRAEVRIDRFDLNDTRDSVALSMSVDPGRRPVLQGIILQGAMRTRPSTIERLVGLRSGRLVTSFDAVRIRDQILVSGLFADVELPVLLSTDDSSAVIQVIVADASPGAFDAALGFQPAGDGRPAGLVGTGRLELNNPLGGGRRFSVLFDRLPGQVSRAEVGLSDPGVLRTMFGLEAAFKGLQQDSTFGRQVFAVTALMDLAADLVLTASFNSEHVRPGTSGAGIAGGRQRIARTDARFAGVGFRYGRVDDRFNPDRGLRLEIRVERGASQRSALTVAAGDTTVVSARNRVERLTGFGRFFLPAGGRRVLVLGFDATVLSLRDLDRGDLARLGGARSLRGYDEDRFEGKTVGRLVSEFRRKVDRRSYAYLFADLGFVDVPAIDGLTPGLEFHPGFGFGAQLDTAAGLVTATYGFNPDDGPTRGRIHVSYSFGL